MAFGGWGSPYTYIHAAKVHHDEWLTLDGKPKWHPIPMLCRLRLRTDINLKKRGTSRLREAEFNVLEGTSKGEGHFSPHPAKSYKASKVERSLWSKSPQRKEEKKFSSSLPPLSSSLPPLSVVRLLLLLTFSDRRSGLQNINN